MRRVRRARAGKETISTRRTLRLARGTGTRGEPQRHEGKRSWLVVVAVPLLIAAVAGAGLLGTVNGFLFADGLSGETVLVEHRAEPQPQITPVAYSHSWYIDDALNTPAAMSTLGTHDAQWLNTETAQFTNPSDCPVDFLTVLDFGHPTTKFSGYASPLDDYAMTLFGKQTSWRTYRQVEQLAKSYVDGWVATTSSCPRLHLALGTSNYNECGKAAGRCDVYTAGQYWDIVTHDVMSYVASKGYSKVTAVWLGDDLEGSWDPWPTSVQFLSGVRDQEQKYTDHAYLVDYGDAHAGACSEVTGGCDNPWTQENVYDAAWGIGWALPLPEAYTARTTQRWEDIAATLHPENPLAPVGVMTECVGTDPLPVTACLTQLGVTPSGATCEFSPAIAYFHMEAQDTSHRLAYATNMQWIDPTPAPPSATPAATTTTCPGLAGGV